MENIENLIRPHLRSLKPYSSARSEHKGLAGILLDANENPFENGFNRYPDPLQLELKQAISKIKGISSNKIFIGNGSDEPIDLLYRIFCEPGKDKALAFSPSYGMYEVSAAINNIELISIPLDENFDLPLEKALASIQQEQPKLIWICSPNNPTGNVVPKEQVLQICAASKALVVVDEAYIDFAPGKSLLNELVNVPNLVVLQTLSKAWGLAGLRLGLAFAHPSVIDILNKVKPPYNVNSASQKLALEALEGQNEVLAQVNLLIQERESLAQWLSEQPFVQTVFPSKANFLLVKMEEANATYQSLASQGILVRNRSSVVPDSLRISIGSPEQNQALKTALQLIYKTQNPI